MANFDEKLNDNQADIFSSDTEDFATNELDDEDLQEIEEKKSQSDNGGKPQKKPLDKKSKIILAIIAVAILAGGILGTLNAIGSKKDADTTQQQGANSGDKPDVVNNGNQNPDGTSNGQTGQNGENTFNVTNPNGATGPLASVTSVPCDTANPNNPSNMNNPSCANVNANGQPIQADANGQPIAQTQTTVADTSGQPVPQQEYNGGYQQSYSHPVARSPKAEKPLPIKPEDFQRREIKKPVSSGLNSYTANKQNRNENGNENTAAPTTNGVQGQSQQQADAINSASKIRPTNVVQKADNVNTFVLPTGSYIPLSMTTTLNSDNPSFFMGIVSQNVYSHNGMHKLLIPMGSKIIGNYAALRNNNDTRLFMFVEKIILPDNRTIAFANENIVDLKGEIGTKGKLNGKFWQRLGKTTLALSFSAADLLLDYRRTKAATKAADKGQNLSSSTWEQVISSPTSTARDIMQTASEAWNSSKNRIKVPIGSRLNVMVSNDIVLPEYQRVRN